MIRAARKFDVSTLPLSQMNAGQPTPCMEGNGWREAATPLKWR
ncbi:hypothetical protein [Sinorhizobium meliloti]|nr:hypothetical protein [Sinorhizobium meliloti]